MEGNLGLVIVIGGFLLLAMLFFWIQDIVSAHWHKKRTGKTKAKDISAAIIVKDPELILVERNKNPDEEVLEEWNRACELVEKDLQAVGAVRWDHSPYPWSVDFGAAAHIREEPYAGILEDVLTRALKQLPGVKEAIREDTEKWVVDGDTTGEELVRVDSVAVDKFLLQYRNKWLAEC